MFEVIEEIGFDGWLTIESFGSNIPEIAAAAAIWRDLVPRPCDFEILTMRVWVPQVSRLRPGRLPIHTVEVLAAKPEPVAFVGIGFIKTMEVRYLALR